MLAKLTGHHTTALSNSIEEGLKMQAMNRAQRVVSIERGLLTRVTRQTSAVIAGKDGSAVHGSFVIGNGKS